jgi:hypothetical protein
MGLWSLQGDASINMLSIDKGWVFSKPLQCLLEIRAPRRSDPTKGGLWGFLEGIWTGRFTFRLSTLSLHNNTTAYKTYNFEFAFCSEGLPKFLLLLFNELELDLKDK